MVEYLDPEIAGEGISADEPWQPFIEAPVIPTYKGIKSIRKYFPQYSGTPYKHKAFPCWLYHPTKQAVVVNSAESAKKYGATWRQSTQDERARGFPEYVWDYSGEWRAMPFNTTPDVTVTGKNLVNTERQTSQSDLIGSIVAAVTAQLAAKQQSAAPISAEPDYAEFVAFKAWKASQIVNGKPAGTSPQMDLGIDEKKLLMEAAKSRNITVDGRWSIDRLKQELDKFE